MTISFRNRGSKQTHYPQRSHALKGGKTSTNLRWGNVPVLGDLLDTFFFFESFQGHTGFELCCQGSSFSFTHWSDFEDLAPLRPAHFINKPLAPFRGTTSFIMQICRKSVAHIYSLLHLRSMITKQNDRYTYSMKYCHITLPLNE